MSVDNTIRELQNYKKQLNEFKEKADDIKLRRVGNESKLEMLKKTELDVITKIKDMGYDPDNLETHIDDKMKELKEIVDKLNLVMAGGSDSIPDDALSLLGIEDNENEDFGDVDFSDMRF